MEKLENYKYSRAKEKAGKIKSFYSNLLTYCIVIPFLVYVNYMTTSYPWAAFPAVGWALGLIGHGLHVYEYVPFLGKDWEKRKIQQLMDSNEF